MRSAVTILASFALLVSAVMTRASEQEAKQAWANAFVAHINKFKRYPPGADRPAGEVIVHFKIDADGHLIDSHIARSSCIDVLDKEALATIARASPLPPELGTKREEFKLPIRFMTVWGDLPPPRTDCLSS